MRRVNKTVSKNHKRTELHIALLDWRERAKKRRHKMGVLGDHRKRDRRHAWNLWRGRMAAVAKRKQLRETARGIWKQAGAVSAFQMWKANALRRGRLGELLERGIQGRRRVTLGWAVHAWHTTLRQRHRVAKSLAKAQLSIRRGRVLKGWQAWRHAPKGHAGDMARAITRAELRALTVGFRVWRFALE